MSGCFYSIYINLSLSLCTLWDLNQVCRSFTFITIWWCAFLNLLVFSPAEFSIEFFFAFFDAHIHWHSLCDSSERQMANVFIVIIIALAALWSANMDRTIARAKFICHLSFCWYYCVWSSLLSRGVYIPGEVWSDCVSKYVLNECLCVSIASFAVRKQIESELKSNVRRTYI